MPHKKQKTPWNTDLKFPVEKRITPEAMPYETRGRLPVSFDSPVIYGARVETSNPYHLRYIEKSIYKYGKRTSARMSVLYQLFRFVSSRKFCVFHIF